MLIPCIICENGLREEDVLIYEKRNEAYIETGYICAQCARSLKDKEKYIQLIIE